VELPVGPIWVYLQRRLSFLPVPWQKLIKPVLLMTIFYFIQNISEVVLQVGMMQFSGSNQAIKACYCLTAQVTLGKQIFL